jgi:Mg2+ and Co2+ transporter CorA
MSGQSLISNAERKELCEAIGKVIVDEVARALESIKKQIMQLEFKIEHAAIIKVSPRHGDLSP